MLTVVFASSGKARSGASRSEHGALAVVDSLAALTQVAVTRVTVDTCIRAPATQSNRIYSYQRMNQSMHLTSGVKRGNITTHHIQKTDRQTDTHRHANKTKHKRLYGTEIIRVRKRHWHLPLTNVMPIETFYVTDSISKERYLLKTTKQVFKNREKWLTSDLLAEPGRTNVSNTTTVVGSHTNARLTSKVVPMSLLHQVARINSATQE